MVCFLKIIRKKPKFSQPLGPWLRELPLLLVPGDAWGFLGSSAAPESFAELARRLGDATRLAAYAAFLGMTEEKQLGLCSFFVLKRDKNLIRTVKNLTIMGVTI